MQREFAPLTADGFFVHVVGGDDATSVVVSGELDLTTCEALQQHITVLVDTKKPVLMDLRDVSFMDSTGLRALWTIQQTLRAQGSRLVLKSPSPSVMRVLDVTHLDGAFDIAPDATG
jgi:anti-sigma B factor antagonist